MKVTKINKNHKAEIDILSKFFDISYQERKGLRGYFEFQKVKLEVEKELKNLFQMLGIQEVEDFEYHFANKIEETVFLNLLTNHSFYYLVFQLGWNEDHPTVTVKNENLQGTYSYIKNEKDHFIRLEQNSFKCKTKTQSLSIKNEDSIVTKLRTTNLGVELTNGSIRLNIVSSIHDLNIGITKIEEFLRSLELYGHVLIVYEKIKSLLPNSIEHYKTIEIDVHINREQLYIKTSNGKITQNIRYLDENLKRSTSLKKEKDEVEN